MTHPLFPNAKINGGGVPEITCEDLLPHLKSVQLIDVRRPDEFVGELGHVHDSKLCTLETELVPALNNFDKTDVYIFICRSGARSTNATAHALSLGYKHVYNLEGGMIAWNSKNLPTAR